MAIDWQGWITFGFVATVVLTGTMAAAQMAGWSRMDIPLMLGTMVTEQPERARVVGSIVHLLNGQVFALFYASAFASIGRATWWLGITFGVVHGISALVLLIALLPGVHPRMAAERSGPEIAARLEPPGPLALNYGAQTPVITLIAHGLYGLILGLLLGPR